MHVFGTRQRMLVLLLVTVASIVGIAGCSEKRALTRVSVRMKWVYNGTVSEFFYGKQRGTFLDNSIALTINPGGPGINGVQLVANGTNTFAVASPEEVIRARANGVPVKAIAAVFQANPVRFLAAKSTGIGSPRDLRGKTVALVQGDNTELQFLSLLEHAQLKRTQVTIVPWTFDMRQLITGRIDVIPAYAFDQPLQLKRLDPTFEFTELNPDSFGIVAGGDVLITSDKNIQEHSELVLRFVRAFLKSMALSRANRESAVRALVTSNRDLSLDYEKELETWSRASAFVSVDSMAIGVMDIGVWRGTLKRLTQYGSVRPHSGFTVSDCFTNDFVQQAALEH